MGIPFSRGRNGIVDLSNAEEEKWEIRSCNMEVRLMML